MIEDAEEHRSSDESRRALVEARNQLDGLIYNTRRSFEEFGSNLSNEDGIAVRDALASSDRALENGDLEAVEEAHKALTNTAQTLADAIYGSLSENLDDDDYDDDDYDDDDFDDDFDDDYDDDDYDDDDYDDEDVDVEIEDDDAQPGA